MASRSENKLTTKAVEAAKVVRDEDGKPRLMLSGKLQPKGGMSDGGGLHLIPTAAGGKAWVYKFQHQGKGKEMSLGPWDDDDGSLAKVRERRNEARKRAKAGSNPITERKAAKAGGPETTFADYARREADILAPNKAKGRKNWLTMMTERVGPLAAKPVGDVTTADIKRALQPLWLAKPPTARVMRGRIERLLFSARAEGLIPGDVWMNPASFRGHLQHAMPKVVRRPVRHQPSLPVEEMAPFMARLRAQGTVLALAVEWTILTTVRLNEGLGARWGEVDLKARTWTVPGLRMKGQEGLVEDHVVPLTVEMLKVLRKARPPYRRPRPGDFIFPSCHSRTGRFSLNGAGVLMRRLDDVHCIHGFRSTFFSFGVGRDYSEKRLHLSLAHRGGTGAAEGIARGVDAAYNRDPQVEQRRIIMRAWSRFCAVPPPAVEVAQPEPLRLAA